MAFFYHMQVIKIQYCIDYWTEIFDRIQKLLYYSNLHNILKKYKELADKPGSVVCDYLSGIIVANNLKQHTIQLV